MDNEIHYLSLYSLIQEYPLCKEKIIKSYIQLIKQLSDTVNYDLDNFINNFIKNLNQINNYGIIYCIVLIIYRFNIK